MSFIKLDRGLLDWEWFDDSNTLKVWLYILLKANFEDKTWHGIEVKTGSFITSISKISVETGLSLQSVRTCLKRLKSTNEITINSTSNYTLISVVKWGVYQCNNQQDNIQNNTQLNKQLTNEQQTTNKQLTTTKEYKEYKERKEINNILSFLNQKTGKNYKLVKSNSQIIEARLKEGFTEDDCKKVIENKVKEWGGTEMQKYLRPDTLFRPNNFQAYLNQEVEVETQYEFKAPEWYRTND